MSSTITFLMDHGSHVVEERGGLVITGWKAEIVGLSEPERQRFLSSCEQLTWKVAEGMKGNVFLRLFGGPRSELEGLESVPYFDDSDSYEMSSFDLPELVDPPPAFVKKVMSQLLLLGYKMTKMDIGYSTGELGGNVHTLWTLQQQQQRQDVGVQCTSSSSPPMSVSMEVENELPSTSPFVPFVPSPEIGSGAQAVKREWQGVKVEDDDMLDLDEEMDVVVKRRRCN